MGATHILALVFEQCEISPGMRTHSRLHLQGLAVLHGVPGGEPQ